MMVYVLILVMANSSYKSGAGGLSSEFNTLEACRAAAAEIARQAQVKSSHILVAVCAAKGKP